MIFISIHDNNNQLYSRHLQWNTFWEDKYIKMRKKYGNLKEKQQNQ